MSVEPGLPNAGMGHAGPRLFVLGLGLGPVPGAPCERSLQASCSSSSTPTSPQTGAGARPPYRKHRRSMTRPGRNDPCPCGSGRKYKRCCRAGDLAADESATHKAQLRAAAASGAWAVEAVPLILTIDEAGSERPVVVLVVAGGKVLHQDMVGRLGGNAPDVAAALAEGIRDAAGALGMWPERVRVRHKEVQTALAQLLAARGVEVELHEELPELRDVALSLMDFMGCPPLWPPVGRTESWLAWGLPRPLVAELFEAAAGFWEEGPWRVMENMQAPRCVLPSGRAWTGMVLGNGGQEFGLVLHSEHADAFERPGLDDPELAFEGVAGRMLSLLFEPLSGMPKRVRKEITVQRWRLADTRACPDLMTVNTPGGGVSEDDARDLVLLLRAMPRFARRHGADLEGELETGRPVTLAWTDAETGISFRYQGEAVPHWGSSGLEDRLPEGVRAEIRQVLEEVHRELEAEGGGGPLDADVLRARANERIQARMDLLNAMPVDELGGLSSAQVQALLSSDWGAGSGAIRLRRDLTQADLAGVPAHEGMQALLEMADAEGGLDRTQTGNLKVAVVRAWVDGVKDTVPEWAELPKAVGDRFWEDDVPALHWLRVLAEVDGLLLPKGSRFTLSPDGRSLLEPGREGERYARLFETCFRRFNLGYTSPFEWPEGQHQVAFTLHGLGAAAREWATARTLLDRRTVVPFAEDRLPRGKHDREAWVFETHILWPLGRFGLVERRWDEGGAAYTYRVTPRYRRFLEFRL